MPLPRMARSVQVHSRRRGGINSDSDVSDEDPNEEGIGTPKTPKNGEVSVITPASKTNGNDRRKIDFTVINNP